MSRDGPYDPGLASLQRSQKQHFCNRARERFKLNVSALQYARLIVKVEQVEHGTRFIYQSTPTRSVWRTVFRGHQMRVVYDEATGRLITCLPLYGRELDRLDPELEQKLNRSCRQKEIRTGRRLRNPIKRVTR